MHGNAADAGEPHNVPVIGGTSDTEGVTAAIVGAP